MVDTEFWREIARPAPYGRTPNGHDGPLTAKRYSDNDGSGIQKGCVQIGRSVETGVHRVVPAKLQIPMPGFTPQSTGHKAQRWFAHSCDRPVRAAPGLLGFATTVTPAVGRIRTSTAFDTPLAWKGEAQRCSPTTALSRFCVLRPSSESQPGSTPTSHMPCSTCAIRHSSSMHGQTPSGRAGSSSSPPTWTMPSSPGY